MSYTVAPDGASITHHACGLTSHNPNDVAQRYCGHCRLFLDPQDAYEFDCRECGRHIISLCGPTCAPCVERSPAGPATRIWSAALIPVRGVGGMD